jgi:hypothetical protein
MNNDSITEESGTDLPVTILKSARSLLYNKKGEVQHGRQQTDLH